MPDGALRELFTSKQQLLDLPPGMSATQWAQAGEIIGELHRGVGWLIGEWWLYGPWEERDRVAVVSAVGWRGPALSTCRFAAQCCKSFPKSRRRELVPYSHHLEVLKLPPTEADELLDRAQREAEETGRPTPAREIRTKVKQHRRATREQELAERTAAASRELGSKRYGVIYADPPWRFEPYSRTTGLDRAADNHYPTMMLDAIRAMQVPAADDAVLFLWATAPMLPEALSVMQAWGFIYRSNFVWNKGRAGTGYWVRNQHEHLLVGTRGSVPAPAPGEQYASIIEWPAEQHSAKPAAFAEMIEDMFPNLALLEMFARAPRLGWDVMGNECDG